MNERMLELYRQAQVPHMAIDPSNNMPYETTTFSAEKFAELIVRECIQIRNELTQFDGTTAYGDGYETGLQDMVDTIKEHFEVN